MNVPKPLGAGLRTNGPYWAHYLRFAVIPKLAVLRETVLERALPSFDGLEEEADRASEEALDRLGRAFDPDCDDPADAYQAALDEGITYYTMRTSARQALLNLYSMALHHFLEQELIFLLRRELLPQHVENERKWFSPEVVLEAFAAQGIDLAAFPEWPKLTELRHVANVAKHAEGRSAEQLWELRPELFTPQFMRGEASSIFDRVKGAVWAPMSGEDLFVGPDDLGEFFDHGESFLERLAAAMDDAAEEPD